MTADKRDKALEKQLIEALRAAYDLGGFDYLSEIEALVAGEAARIRRRSRTAKMAQNTQPMTEHRERYQEIIGDSPAMLRVFGLLDKVAPSMVPVLIQGESGTGKELIARAIHTNSPRKDREYVTENCAAIPETLLESELFGYKRGAFTGAAKDKRGLFVAADGGTLFLDEIGDMSLSMQKKLLRVLQDGEIRPVGSNDLIHVDVRVLSASNKNLQEMVAERRFREDLFFRLNTITVELPPLRERKEDVPALANHFITKVSAEMGIEPVPIADEAMEALAGYRWPGNIRELENEVRRCLALKGDAEKIEIINLSEEVRSE